jgi:signal transduction histidine kinase
VIALLMLFSVQHICADDKTEAEKYLLSGVDNYKQNNYAGALNDYRQALNYSEKSGDTKTKVLISIACYSNIGAIYMDMYNYSKAEEYYLKSKKLIEEYRNKYNLTQFISATYYSLAGLYRGTEKAQEGFLLIQQAVDAAASWHESTGRIRALTLLSRYYLLTYNDLESAFKYALEALKIAEESKLKYDYVLAEIELMTICLNVHHEKEALKYALYALAKTDSTDWNSLEAIHYSLVGIYANLGEMDKVEESLNQYRDFMQRMSDNNLHVATQNMEVKYETEKKELQIVNQQAVISQQNTQRIAYLAGLALTLVIIILTLNMVRLQKRRNKELADMNVTKDKFFSIISHDLKNPAIAQRNALQMLLDNIDNLDTKSVTAYYTELLKSSDAQVELLFNLLSWAQVETGRMPFHPAVFDLKTVIRPETELMLVPLANKQIELSCSLPNNTQAYGDKNMIGTVVRNLLSNAIKFTHTGGQINLDVTVQKDSFLISIKDDGVGMPPETMGNLFRIDKQTSTTGTQGESGSGLGLIVCKELVEKNGGTISVVSEEGKGTTFHFTVPVAHK